MPGLSPENRVDHAVLLICSALIYTDMTNRDNVARGRWAAMAIRDHDQEPDGQPMRPWFQELQGLDDAIAFRVARLAQPCPDCDLTDDRCDDHSCDVALVDGYRQRAAALLKHGSPATAPTLHVPA